MVTHRHADLLAPAKQLKRRRARQRLFLGLGAVVVVIGGLMWFANQERWLIQTVVVEGNDLVSTTALTDTATKVLAGRWWGLFSRRHVLWYPRDELVSTLYQNFPRLATVGAAIEYPNLRVQVVERQPIAIWCPRSFITAPSPDQFCYFIDETGRVFSSAPHFSSPVFFTLVSDWADLSPLGEVPIPAGEVMSLLNFQTALREIFTNSVLANFEPVRAEPLGAGDYELLATRSRVGAAESILIKVNVHRNLAETTPLLTAAVSSPKMITEITAAGHLPETFDLRFPGKVFYRFEPETPAESPVAETEPTPPPSEGESPL